ncbi:MAG TPA: YidB family protein [Candidatus Eisenbacteria bacterium]|nr:YidB family protein [Candidatus Eisenbacteria bacterium]
MALLDQLANQVLASLQGGQIQGGASRNQATDLMQAVLSMLNQQGGLGGLLQQFQQKGMGNIADSWVGTGQNQPISGRQLEDVLGADTVGRLSQQAGLPADQGLGALAQLLPQMIDTLTPQGRVPQQNDLLAAGLDFLKKTLA